MQKVKDVVMQRKQEKPPKEQKTSNQIHAVLVIMNDLNNIH